MKSTTFSETENPVKISLIETLHRKTTLIVGKRRCGKTPFVNHVIDNMKHAKCYIIAPIRCQDTVVGEYGDNKIYFDSLQKYCENYRNYPRKNVIIVYDGCVGISTTNKQLIEIIKNKHHTSTFIIQVQFFNSQEVVDYFDNVILYPDNYVSNVNHMYKHFGGYIPCSMFKKYMADLLQRPWHTVLKIKNCDDKLWLCDNNHNLTLALQLHKKNIDNRDLQLYSKDIGEFIVIISKSLEQQERIIKNIVFSKLRVLKYKKQYILSNHEQYKFAISTNNLSTIQIDNILRQIINDQLVDNSKILLIIDIDNFKYNNDLRKDLILNGRHYGIDIINVYFNAHSIDNEIKNNIDTVIIGDKQTNMSDNQQIADYFPMILDGEKINLSEYVDIITKYTCDNKCIVFDNTGSYKENSYYIDIDNIDGLMFDSLSANMTLKLDILNKIYALENQLHTMISAIVELKECASMLE
jgi:hypothetical protein